MSNVKTGKEFLESFFKDLKGRNELDAQVVAVLVDLFENNKLTEKNISNRLEEIRREINEN